MVNTFLEYPVVSQRPWRGWRKRERGLEGKKGTQRRQGVMERKKEAGREKERERTEQSRFENSYIKLNKLESVIKGTASQRQKARETAAKSGIP